MNDFEGIKNWIDNDEIINHIDELLEIDLTPEIIGLLSQVDFSIGDIPNSVLLKVQVLNDKVIKRNQRIACERLQSKKHKVIEQKGSIGIKIIDSNKPEEMNKSFNRNIAMIYKRLGDNVNAYKFFSIANEQGLDCSSDMKYYEGLFSEQTFKPVEDIISKAKFIYDSEKVDKIQAVQDFATIIIEKYTYFLQGEIDEGTETNLKDSLADYLIAKVIGKRIGNCSAYTYLLSSGVEGILKTLYYKPYIVYLEEDFANNPDDEFVSTTYNRVKNKIVKGGQNLFDFHFSLGTFYHLSGQEHFLKWLNQCHDENLTRRDLDLLRDNIDRIATLWRNPVAHSVYMEEWKFKYLLNEIIFKDDCILSQIIKNVSYVEYDRTKQDKFDIESFIKELEIFKTNNNGYPKLTSNDVEEARLARIVVKLRQAYKGKGGIKLTQEMINKLNQANFEWEVKKVNWFDDFFEKLLEYKNNHNGFDGVGANKELSHIIASIRRNHNKEQASGLILRSIDRHRMLTAEQIYKLSLIDFPWEVKDWFTSFYEKLIAYKEEHGSLAGVITDKEIGGTVCSIRKAYKGKGGTKLTQEMIDKLNVIGFPWEARRKKEDNLSV